MLLCIGVLGCHLLLELSGSKDFDFHVTDLFLHGCIEYRAFGDRGLMDGGFGTGGLRTGQSRYCGERRRYLRVSGTAAAAAK